MHRELPRSLDFWGAVAIMVGIIIGGGIFQSPAAIADSLSSPAFILSLWGVGGVLALFGALTYAELATMHPESGGIYVFLREAFGRPTAFVFGWTYLLITKPLGAAGVAMIFSDHLLDLFSIPRPDPAHPFPSHLNPAVLCTIGLLTLLTALNVRGVRLGGRVALALTSFKFFVLVAVVALALGLWKGDASNLLPAPPAPGDHHPGLLRALVVVMGMILWTYDGWSDVGAVAGEVRDPARTLPRVYFTGAAAILAIYLVVNAVYMWIIPLEEMRRHETIAPLVVERLLGPGAGVLVTCIILVSTLGSTHGSIITGARVSYQQARDGLLFSFLGRVHPRHATPSVSLWIQLIMSCLAVWQFGTFEKLAGGFIFSMWIFYALGALAIFVLRARRPDAPRPFRCPGYPAVPAVFVLASVAMTIMSLWDDIANPDSRGMSTLPWLGVLLLGYPAYYLWTRLTRRSAHNAPLTPPAPPSTPAG